MDSAPWGLNPPRILPDIVKREAAGAGSEGVESSSPTLLLHASIRFRTQYKFMRILHSSRKCNIVGYREVFAVRGVDVDKCYTRRKMALSGPPTLPTSVQQRQIDDTPTTQSSGKIYKSQVTVEQVDGVFELSLIHI